MNEAHDLLYEQLRFHYLKLHTKTDVLRTSIINYRLEKGMSLSYDAFKYLNDNRFYEFISFHTPRTLNSRELVLFDKLSESPYYVGKNEIFISDPMHQFTLAMTPSFIEFIEFLKQ